MAQICDLCQRGAQTTNSRSKSNVPTKRRQKINLQSKKVDGKRLSVCTQCLRLMNKKTA